MLCLLSNITIPKICGVIDITTLAYDNGNHSKVSFKGCSLQSIGGYL